MALDDARLGSGWHDPEEVLCWIDGDAVLRVDGAALVESEVAVTGRYWREAAAGKAEGAWGGS